MHRPAFTIILILLVLVCGPHPVTAGELSELSFASPPELNLPDLSAQQHSLDAFAGQVLLVNFWASWCIPCTREIPSMQRLAAALKDKPFAIIGINVGEGQRRVQAAVRRLQIDFTVLLDKDNSVFERWGAKVLPTSYILDRGGRMRYIAQGELEWDRPDIVDRLATLARQPLQRQ